MNVFWSGREFQQTPPISEIHSGPRMYRYIHELHEMLWDSILILNRNVHCAKASPWPQVKWLKDGVPVSKRVTISNTEGASQLLLPAAERTDTGVYTIMVKNIVGQESFSVEIRVTGQTRGRWLQLFLSPICLSDCRMPYVRSLTCRHYCARPHSTFTWHGPNKYLIVH